MIKKMKITCGRRIEGKYMGRRWRRHDDELQLGHAACALCPLIPLAGGSNQNPADNENHCDTFPKLQERALPALAAGCNRLSQLSKTFSNAIDYYCIFFIRPACRAPPS